jgi:hypothetical protein
MPRQSLTACERHLRLLPLLFQIEDNLLNLAALRRK